MKTYKYTTSVTIGKDLNGKPIKKYIRADNKRELEIKKAEYLTNMGCLITNNATTFEQFASIWFNLRIKTKSKSYQNATQIFLRVHILPALGKMPISSIRKMNIETLMNTLVDKPNTANKVLIIVKSILELAVENEVVEKNVARSIRPPKYIKQEKQPLTQEQQELIMASTHKYADFFKVLLYTGMRRRRNCFSNH